jgi:hypothetical protein
VEAEERVRFVGEVGDDDREHVGLNLRRVDAHAAARSAVGVGDAREEARFLEDARAVRAGLVVEEEVPHGVVGDDDIRPAVAVGVARHHAQRLAHGPRGVIAARLADVNARLLRHVLELRSVHVAIEFALRAGELLRRDVRPHPARQHGRDAEVVRRRPREVVAHEEVEPAVAIEVEPDGRRRERDRFGVPGEVRRAGGPLRLAADPGAVGRVLERLAAPRAPAPLPAGVAEESVAAARGDEQVRPAVVVVVADRDAHAVEFDVQPARGGHVLVAASAIAVQGRRGSAAGGWRIAGPRAAVDEEEVRLAVAVEVEHRDAGAHRFGQEFLAGGAVEVREADAGLLGDIDEPHARGRVRFGVVDRAGREPAHDEPRPQRDRAEDGHDDGQPEEREAGHARRDGSSVAGWGRHPRLRYRAPREWEAAGPERRSGRVTGRIMRAAKLNLRRRFRAEQR